MDIWMPSDFPKDRYLRVEDHVSRFLSATSAGAVKGFSEYMGGWNALAFRFRAADVHGRAALVWLERYQGSLSNDERYEEECELFSFFANMVATVESCCFGIYHLGVIANKRHFSLPADGVTVRATATAILGALPSSPMATALSKLTADPAWRKSNLIRNILVHRESPGRTIFLSTGGSAPLPPAKWTSHNYALDSSLVSPDRSWLGATIQELVEAAEALVIAALPLAAKP